MPRVFKALPLFPPVASTEGVNAVPSRDGWRNGHHHQMGHLTQNISNKHPAARLIPIMMGSPRLTAEGFRGSALVSPRAVGQRRFCRPTLGRRAAWLSSQDGVSRLKHFERALHRSSYPHRDGNTPAHGRGCLRFRPCFPSCRWPRA